MTAALDRGAHGLPPPGWGRVLLVDDEPANTLLLERALQSEHYEHVLSVNDARQALAAFQQFCPDVVLLDLHMPYVDGFALLEAFAEATPADTYLPVVVLTADVALATKLRALSLGARDFLTKPFDVVEVRLRVHNFMQASFANRALRQARADAQRQAAGLRPFVSAATAALVDRNEGLVTGTGEVRDFALLFTDMRNFTGFADHTEPAVVFEALAESLDVQVSCVMEQRGYVDKIYGDGLLAYFEGADRAVRAVRCALDIQARVAGLDPRAATTALPVGLGVHLGAVLFGMLGNRERKEHTVVGDAVNTCARVCGQARPFQVVATDQLRAAAAECSAACFRSLGMFNLKGKPEPLPLFEVVRRSEELAPGAGGTRP